MKNTNNMVTYTKANVAPNASIPSATVSCKVAFAGNIAASEKNILRSQRKYWSKWINREWNGK